MADEHDTQSVFRVEKNEGQTSFEAVEELDKPYVIYELLGGSPSDLLLPRNFLIVEGPSEAELFKKLISRFYRDKPKIQVISACGDTHQAERSINAILKIFQPLGNSLFQDRLLLLCDKPSDRARPGFNEFERTHREYFNRQQIKVLPVGSLEEYYPEHNDWKRTCEQVSGMSGKQKRSLAKRVGDEIEQLQFEREMPVLFESLTNAWAQAF